MENRTLSFRIGLILTINFVIFLFTIKKSFAQCFQAAIISELASNCVSNPEINVLHTGNDSRVTLLGVSPSTWIEVNVFDGDNPGFSCNDGGTCCNIDLPLYIVDPDVVLVESNNPVNWYAIVVYADVNNNCICDLYEWQNGNFTQVTTGGYPYTLQNSDNNDAVYSSSINIDADDNGNFCIVWDDAETQNIMAQGGYVDPNGLPTLCGDPTSKVIRNCDACHSPDVSLIKRGCSVVSPYPCFSNVFITYAIYGTYDSLVVEGDNFEDWICGGGHIQNWYEHFSTNASTGQFLYPRIACPLYDNNGNLGREWTVVVEEYDPLNDIDNIIGFTRIGGTLYGPNCYNDAQIFSNTCPINDNSIRNQYPVVTYDFNYEGFTVGWETDYSSGTLSARGVIALTCDVQGADNGPCNSDYLIIFSGNYSNTTSLSLSGRNVDYSPLWGQDDPIQYTFYFDSNVQVLYKDVEFAQCQLRKGNLFQVNSYILYPNPFSDKVNFNSSELNGEFFRLEIYNLMGESLFLLTGDKNKIKNEFESISGSLKNGIYISILKNEFYETTMLRMTKI